MPTKDTAPLALDLTVNTDTLLRAVGRVGRAIGDSTFDALRCVAFDATQIEGQIRVMGMAQDRAITTWIGAEIRTPGAFLLEHKDLYNLIGTWPAHRPVRLTLPERRNKVTVAAGGFNVNIEALLFEDFPLIPLADTEGALYFEKAGELLDLLDQVREAAANDSATVKSRPILAGVHVLLNGSQMILEAADGLRFHRVELVTAGSKQVDIVIPATAVEHASQLLDRSQPVHIAFPEKDGQVAQLIFVQDMLQILSNTINEGKYPDLLAVIPKQTAVTAQLAGDALLSCLARADKMSTMHRVNLSVKPGAGVSPGRVIFNSVEASRGAHTEALSAAVSGPLEISLNGELLAAMVKAAKIAGGGQAKLQFGSAREPVVIQNETLTAVMMPMSR